MPEKTKRSDMERDELSENESADEVSNDSLGTVDTSDSTGLGDFARHDAHKPGPERHGKREPGIAPS
jgi:hypothetical protein